MAVDQFLKLDKIDGESTDSKHAKELELLAWSWGASNATTVGSATGGAGAGKAHFQDLSITKYVDSATPKLLNALATGSHIATGQLTVRKAGATALEYITVEFKEKFVTSVSTGGFGGEDKLTENVVFAFASMNLIYTPQDSKGGAGTAIPFSWSVVTNSAKV